MDYIRFPKSEDYTRYLATLSLIAGIIGLSLLLQFIFILPTRLAVVRLPQLLVLGGALLLAVDFFLVPASGMAAIVMSALALNKLRHDTTPQLVARHARIGMALGILIIPVYVLWVILFSLVIFLFQVDMV